MIAPSLRKLVVGLGLAAMGAALLAVLADGDEPPKARPPGAGSTPSAAVAAKTIDAKAPLLAAAGDIACAAADPNFNAGQGTADDCAQGRTSELLLRRPYDAVLALGDLQYRYPSGSRTDYTTSYGPTWGRLFEITRPVPGNHEYDVPEGAAYFDYFGARAGQRGLGWYGFRAGSWRVLVLNSNCDMVACGPGSPQVEWLRREFRKHPRRCTLALMHHPRFSSGPHGKDGPDRTIGWLWRTLYRHRTELVLSGHDHFFERFAPQRPDGRLDRRRGITEMVVGTGGRSLYRFVKRRPHGRARHRAFGVLSLRLLANAFRWRFLAAPGADVLDAGRRACH